MFTRYIDPTTELGFKKLLGEEESKPVLILNNSDINLENLTVV